MRSIWHVLKEGIVRSHHHHHYHYHHYHHHYHRHSLDYFFFFFLFVPPPTTLALAYPSDTSTESTVSACDPWSSSTPSTRVPPPPTLALSFLRRRLRSSELADTMPWTMVTVLDPRLAVAMRTASSAGPAPALRDDDDDDDVLSMVPPAVRWFRSFVALAERRLLPELLAPFGSADGLVLRGLVGTPSLEERVARLVEAGAAILTTPSEVMVATPPPENKSRSRLGLMTSLRDFFFFFFFFLGSSPPSDSFWFVAERYHPYCSGAGWIPGERTPRGNGRKASTATMIVPHAYPLPLPLSLPRLSNGLLLWLLPTASIPIPAIPIRTSRDRSDREPIFRRPASCRKFMVPSGLL
mmetsp:Transcript_22962/g.63692  ORF Transcript_22962/g.63692 Transcript_22962/m.63692 type:complete len:353 (+) Transcript_22962:264-1322(+)